VILDRTFAMALDIGAVTPEFLCDFAAVAVMRATRRLDWEEGGLGAAQLLIFTCCRWFLMHDLIDLVVDWFQKAPPEIFIGRLTHRLMDQMRFGHVHPYLPLFTPIYISR
jgi:hypothetical protein